MSSCPRYPQTAKHWSQLNYILLSPCQLTGTGGKLYRRKECKAWEAIELFSKLTKTILEMMLMVTLIYNHPLCEYASPVDISKDRMSIGKSLLTQLVAHVKLFITWTYVCTLNGTESLWTPFIIYYSCREIRCNDPVADCWHGRAAHSILLNLSWVGSELNKHIHVSFRHDSLCQQMFLKTTLQNKIMCLCMAQKVGVHGVYATDVSRSMTK